LTAEEAHTAYVAKSIELFGEFSIYFKQNILYTFKIKLMEYSIIGANTEHGQKIRSRSQYIQTRFLSSELIAAIEELEKSSAGQVSLGCIMTFGYFSSNNVCLCSGGGNIYSFSL
jgi:hypothetical protein